MKELLSNFIGLGKPLLAASTGIGAWIGIICHAINPIIGTLIMVFSCLATYYHFLKNKREADNIKKK